MSNLNENRESLFSSISEDSLASTESNDFNNCLNCKDKQISYAQQLLFWGPLILCLILLISGILIFLFIGKRNKTNEHFNSYFTNDDWNADLSIHSKIDFDRFELNYFFQMIFLRYIVQILVQR